MCQCLCVWGGGGGGGVGGRERRRVNILQGNLVDEGPFFLIHDNNEGPSLLTFR
jgi:hypothetical protein